ncbi:hypothetical protein K2D_10860 [Enterococcus hirae]|nr:hypothetical protein K2D_10860 [Enterococcus hirae]
MDNLWEKKTMTLLAIFRNTLPLPILTSPPQVRRFKLWSAANIKIKKKKKKQLKKQKHVKYKK